MSELFLESGTLIILVIFEALQQGSAPLEVFAKA